MYKNDHENGRVRNVQLTLNGSDVQFFENNNSEISIARYENRKAKREMRLLEQG